MLAIHGIYKNGLIQLDNPPNTNKTLRVIVTFVDEEIKQDVKTKQNKIDINTFSFLQSMEASKDFKGSFSDSLIQERRLEL